MEILTDYKLATLHVIWISKTLEILNYLDAKYHQCMNPELRHIGASLECDDVLVPNRSIC